MKEVKGIKRTLKAAKVENSWVVQLQGAGLCWHTNVAETLADTKIRAIAVGLGLMAKFNQSKFSIFLTYGYGSDVFGVVTTDDAEEVVISEESERSECGEVFSVHYATCEFMQTYGRGASEYEALGFLLMAIKSNIDVDLKLKNSRPPKAWGSTEGEEG